MEHLDFKERKAYVKQRGCGLLHRRDRYTQVRCAGSCAGSAREREANPEIAALRSHGDVLVRSQVVGFKKIKFFTNENIGAGNLELPENEMHTTSYWITLERRCWSRCPLPSANGRAACLACCMRWSRWRRLLLMCDGRDLGTAIGEKPPSPNGEDSRWILVNARRKMLSSRNCEGIF